MDLLREKWIREIVEEVPPENDAPGQDKDDTSMVTMTGSSRRYPRIGYLNWPRR